MPRATSSPASFLQSQNGLADLPPTFVSQASSVHPHGMYSVKNNVMLVKSVTPGNWVGD